jgi:hypothetical protein
VRVHAGAAERRLLELELEAVARQCLQDLYGLRDDLRPDAVTGEDCNLHDTFIQPPRRHGAKEAKSLLRVIADFSASWRLRG